MRPVAPGPLAPGDSLDLLPPAPLPPGLEWAEGSPFVAQALGRAVTAVDQGAHWVPEPVRERLRTRLDAWDGSAPGLGVECLSDGAYEHGRHAVHAEAQGGLCYKSDAEEQGNGV
ncbi:hypothetical protein ACFVWD_58370, partial [Streptomyces sp. NPDC058086]